MCPILIVNFKFKLLLYGAPCLLYTALPACDAQAVTHHALTGVTAPNIALSPMVTNAPQCYMMQEAHEALYELQTEQQQSYSCLTADLTLYKQVCTARPASW